MAYLLNQILLENRSNVERERREKCVCSKSVCMYEINVPMCVRTSNCVYVYAYVVCMTMLCVCLCCVYDYVVCMTMLCGCVCCVDVCTYARELCLCDMCGLYDLKLL